MTLTIVSRETLYRTEHYAIFWVIYLISCLLKITEIEEENTMNNQVDDWQS